MPARQPSLFPRGPQRKGVVERFAEQDLRELRRLETIAPGMKAIEAAYRLVAREVDRAESEGPDGGWRKLNATRELRAVRERLGVLPPESSGDERDELLAALSATPRNGPAA